MRVGGKSLLLVVAGYAVLIAAFAVAIDRWLHLFEVYDLDLNCDLAVLSSCDTEAGRRVQGEGTFALSRGFLVADVIWVLASMVIVLDGLVPLTTAGFWGVLIIADVVAVFAVLKYIGLRRLAGR